MTLFPVFVHSRSLSACMPFSPFSTTRESRLYVMLNIIRVTEPSVRWVKKMFTKKLNLPYDLSSYHHWNKSGI